MTDSADRLAMIKHVYTDRGLGRLLSEDDVRWLVREIEGLRLELASVRGLLVDATGEARELRAKLIDLAEEWSSTGGGMATSPYDAGVLDTYTAVVRRIRQVLADPGNVIEQDEEGTS